MKKELTVMLDMSRNGVMTVPALKKYIDIISAFGYTSLQLYTEDTYVIDGEPLFGYLRGAYTKEEFALLDDYASSKGVELVPAIQTLAHLGSIFRWSDYLKINDAEDILLADDERTYALIDKMFKTMRSYYKTDKINIGMDEAHLIGRGKYYDLHGATDRSEIMLRHVNKVCETAKKYGFKPMMWSDMFFRLAANSYYAEIDEGAVKKVKEKIPENLTLVYWDYYSQDEKHYKDMLKTHKAITDNVAFAGGAWAWVGFAPNNGFSISTMKASVKQLEKYGVNEYIVTVWGDDGKECSYFSVLPSLLCAAEFYKGNYSMKSIKARFKEVTGVSFDDFMKLDLPDKIYGKAGDFPTCPCKYMLYNDTFYGIFDKTVAEGGADKYRAHAKTLKNAAKRAGEFGYIFNALALLTETLSVKYDLGTRTRKAYESKDKDGLTALLKDYKKAITLTEKFYCAFEHEWYKECKPFGFEVQTARIGGVILRLRQSLKRLKDYCDGKIDSIPELETPVLSFDNSEKFDGKEICFNDWKRSITTCIV